MWVWPSQARQSRSTPVLEEGRRNPVREIHLKTARLGPPLREEKV